MPHDNCNTLLQVGDLVILRGRVSNTTASEDYCNITIESLHGRKPDGLKESICAINSAVLEKAPNQNS